MFAENGYRGTNLRDLAARLNLSKSALYKHFKSKEDIWDSLLDYMDDYYNRHFDAAYNNRPIPDSIESFVEGAMRTVRFTITDESVAAGRRLVMSEQFHSRRAGSMVTTRYVRKVREKYITIFEGMMKKGLIEKDDPEFLSILFVSPVSEMINLADHEPERQERILDEIESFIVIFINRLAKKPNRIP